MSGDRARIIAFTDITYHYCVFVFCPSPRTPPHLPRCPQRLSRLPPSFLSRFQIIKIGAFRVLLQVSLDSGEEGTPCPLPPFRRIRFEYFSIVVILKFSLVLEAQVAYRRSCPTFCNPCDVLLQQDIVASPLLPPPGPLSLRRFGGRLVAGRTRALC